MNNITTKHLYAISEIVTRSGDWKSALNEITSLVRTFLIFDNLAVYLYDPDKKQLDVGYARAVGRGKKAEAESAWGEAIANQVVEEKQPVLVKNTTINELDRIKKPFILGIPLMINDHCLGAFILVRFGGPAFTITHRKLSHLIAQQIALLVERQRMQQDYQIVIARERQAILQEDFISTISHELRNPLGFIKGYTTTLLRTDTSWDEATRKDFLNIIDRETDHLQELIDNLLDSSRLQTGQFTMKFNQVLLNELVKNILERMRLHNPNFSYRIEESGNTRPIEADPQRINQVLENIINNAQKYAPSSPLLVTIKQEDTQSYLSIQDFGPGIAERYLPYLFDRFFRSPDISSQVHGTGLGLYICKQIIQAHHGQLSVSSKEGQGTTFNIMLPNTYRTN